jgi:hypothetical protein
LLLPPLVTSATSREASVFSILLLMLLPQSIDRSRSVHLPGEADVHLASGADMHLASEIGHDFPPEGSRSRHHVPIRCG